MRSSACGADEFFQVLRPLTMRVLDIRAKALGGVGEERDVSRDSTQLLIRLEKEYRQRY